jgi:hypothetical protein
MSIYSESVCFDLDHKDLVLEAFSLMQEQLFSHYQKRTQDGQLAPKWDVTENDREVKINVVYEMPWLTYEENMSRVNGLAEVCQAFIQGYLIGKGILIGKSYGSTL